MPTNSPENSDNNRIEDHDHTEDSPSAETNEEATEASPYANQEQKPIEVLGEEELDFLNEKGAVQILPQLADGPKQFSEINNALTVSQGTVSTRLTEGAKLGLWTEEFHYPDEGGKLKQYKLQPYAQPLADIAKAKNIAQLAEEHRKARKEYESGVDDFFDEIKPRE